MPSLKTRPPTASRARQVLTLPDLTGGLDLRRSPTVLHPSRARQLKNWSLSVTGELAVRAGYTAASTASFGSNPQGGVRVYLASTAFTVMAIDGAVYAPTDAWVRGASVFSTISTGNQVDFPFDRTMVAVLDGANRPRFSTNGTSWLLMGIDASTSGPTLSSLSTGGLSSGEFAVAYAYKHRGTAFESNVSPESTRTITGSSGALTVTATASTDTKVDAYVWYARHVSPDGETVLRKVSSGSSATVVVTSSAWTSADEAPTTHDVPPALSFGRIWKNRWWARDATVTNRLRFTELFLPQAWTAEFYIDIPFEHGDAITFIQPIGDTLTICGQTGVFLVIGQTSLDFEVRPSQGADHGACGFRSGERVEQALLHASVHGVDSFDGAVDRSQEFDIRRLWTDLTDNTSAANLAKIAVVYDVANQEVRIALPRVYPTAARGELVLDLVRTSENEGTPAWTTTDRDIAFYMPWSGNEATAGNTGRLFSIPSTGGFVFEEATGTTANSSNMVAEYEGPGLALGLHRARVVDAHVEYEPHGGAFSIETVVDGLSQGSITLTIGAGLAVYGTGVYGTATYGSASRRKAYTLLPLEAEGRVMVDKCVYTGQDAFRLFTISHVIVPESAPRQVSE